MNKFAKRLTGAFVGLAMAVGVGVAIGASTKEAIPVHAASYSDVLVSSSSSTYYSAGYLTGSGTTSQATWTSTGFTAVQTKNSGNNVSLTYAEIRVYQYHSFTVTPNSGYQIDSIVCTANSNSYANAIGGSALTNCAKSTNGSTVTLTPTNGSAAVGFTNSAQSRINSITVNYSTSSSASLSSISLSGSMTKTSYTTAENWDPTGLVVTGHYDDSSTKNLTAGATFTYYNSSDEEVATPKDLGTGSGQTLKVVASYTGVSDTAKYTASSTIAVTKATAYTLVTDATQLTKGTTAIIVGNGDSYTKAMIATYKTANGSFGNNASVTLSDGFNAGSVATSASATVFTLGGSAGNWTISNGDNKLGFTGSSNNNIQFNENLEDTFTISSPDSGTYVTIESNSYPGRGLRMNPNGGSCLFSNYGSGNQSPVYLFADIAEVTYGTTNHIKVATLPQTHWHVGQTFSDAGIVINAWDSSDESGNSKVVNTHTTSVSDVTSGVAFTDEDIGPHTVTVTYTEDEAVFTDTYSIYVYATATYKLVTEEPSGGWAGSYIITSEITGATNKDKVADGTYAMRSTGTNLDYVGNYDAINPTTAQGVTTVTTGQEFQFSIASVTGGYSIQGQDGKYIGWNSSSTNGMLSSDSALVNSLSIAGGDVTILCSAGTKGIKLDKSSGQFRYYSDPVVQLYKLVESTEAVDYANDFLDTLKGGVNPVCKVTAQGVVQTDIDDLKVAWELLADGFNGLSTNAIKQQFTLGNADASSEDPIGQALALYDHIAYVYGHRLESENVSDFDFMGRNIVPMQNSGVLLRGIAGVNESTMPLVIAVAALGTAAAAGFFLFQRKRKEF